MRPFRLACNLTLHALLLASNLVYSSTFNVALAKENTSAISSPASKNGLALSTQVSPDGQNASQIENMLASTLIEISQGRLQSALTSVDRLILKAPNFKLAHLIRGDLLMALAQREPAIQTNPSNKVQSEIKNYREEASRRLEHYFEQKKPRGLPDVIWQLDAQIPYAMVVDTNKSRLYLYRNNNGKLNYIADYYVTLGKNGVDKQVQGDKRTPLGVYTIGSRLKRELPDLYGEMAFPLNYPNEWDSHQKKTGSGIWLHGTPSNTYSRAPQDSDGCIVMANPELRTLQPVLQQGNTIIVVSNDVKWNSSQNDAQKIALSKTIETWRKNWQSKDTEQYLSHYSQRFFSQTTDFAGWAAHKRIVQATPAKLTITLSKMSILRYPDRQSQMAVVTFEQDYQTDQIISRVMKRQYWIFENSRWKILYEGPA